MLYRNVVHSGDRHTALDNSPTGDSTLLAIGEVVTRDGNVGNGIRFTKVLPEDREELERFLQAAETERQQQTAIPLDGA